MTLLGFVDSARSATSSGNIAAMLGLLPALQPAFTRYETYLKTINREDFLG